MTQANKPTQIDLQTAINKADHSINHYDLIIMRKEQPHPSGIGFAELKLLTEAARQHLNAQQSEWQVPEGFALVPIYPTSEIRDAFFSYNSDQEKRVARHDEFRTWHGDFGNFAASWQLAVTVPSPPKQGN